MVVGPRTSLGGIPTTGTRAWKEKTPSLGGFSRGKIPGWGMGATALAAAQRAWNAGITSRANQRSCSLNSLAESPSAQWIMKSLSPGYFAATDLIPSITCDGGPQNHAFCWIPSASDG